MHLTDIMDLDLGRGQGRNKRGGGLGFGGNMGGGRTKGRETGGGCKAVKGRLYHVACVGVKDIFHLFMVLVKS